MAGIRTIEPFVGFQPNATITDSRLINATIISVKREGFSYNSVSTTPSVFQYQFIPSQGKIKFDPRIPFTYVFERIHIIYKI